MTDPIKGEDIDLSIVTDFATLLKRRAQASPDRPAILFLGDGEAETSRETFASLDWKARAIAAALQAKAAPGDRVLLLFGSGLDFVCAFFGCLYAGMIAIPAHLPRNNDPLDRLDKILADASATVVIGTTGAIDSISGRISAYPHLVRTAYLSVDEAYRDGSASFMSRQIDPSSLAFLQYTSGSTGDPKGVMVSHGNLIANERVIRQAFLHNHDSVLVGWLPLFHDMGLIGNVLQPIYSGFTSVLMPPVAAIQKPMRVIRAISKYRGNTCGGPNFFFDLCVSKFNADELKLDGPLDLSCWTRAFSGSEPVRKTTMDRFYDVFQRHGFQRAALYPCYGLAEATLFATGASTFKQTNTLNIDKSLLESHRVSPSSDDNTNVSIVSCGPGWPNHEICIVDPVSLTKCEADQIGEIWFRGPSVARGYWENGSATVDAFHGVLTSDPVIRYLRTGDLGFMHDGELYVTGRLKDVVIIRGRNHYPADIEATVAAAHADLRPTGGATFSIDVDGMERLCVIHEVERKALRRLDKPSILRAVRTAVAAHHDLQLFDLVLIRPGELPKTTSGKTRRRTCRDLYNANRFQRVGEDVHDISASTATSTSSSG